MEFDAFRDALLKRLYEVHGANGPVELSEKIDIPRGSVHRVENAKGMSAAMLLKLCAAAGLDMKTLVSGGEPEIKEAPSLTSLAVKGSVSAGDGVADYQEDEAPVAEFESIVGPMRSKKSWRLGKGPPFLLKIVGDSMAPEYPEGAHIVVRMVFDANKVPGGTPVIFHQHDSGENFFKIYQPGAKDKNGRLKQIIGSPVNPAHPVLVWSPRDASITHVVMGMVK